jgi:hypothetical protein
MIAPTETMTLFPQDVASYQSVTLPISDIAGLPMSSDLALVYIFLYGQVAENLVLSKPLLITLEQEDGSYIFSDSEFDIYGMGDSAVDAYQDYLSSLSEYYEILRHHSEQEPETATLFSHLRSFVNVIAA